eukprot:CAMPEP_0195294850 /NCGR_PEP_ID=MMETSP0707-20130614/16034_1 /TAXON_ID=33640 /ORGANISM="Asterionellopsis glacialis, Strain CCMP134" /LENGTH=96 /DNA_ID=CAMNT_0040355929 /DNA_START=530 /DNA_END=820 /DNA_ORIENTATION=-
MVKMVRYTQASLEVIRTKVNANGDLDIHDKEHRSKKKLEMQDIYHRFIHEHGQPPIVPKFAQKAAVSNKFASKVIKEIQLNRRIIPDGILWKDGKA